MFGPQVTLFNLFRINVKIDWSWIFIALLIAWSLANGYFPNVYEGLPKSTYWGMGIVGAVGLFFSIIFHEFAHSLVARMYGVSVKSITLFVFGGVAEMESEPKSARAEFKIAIAGPLASLFLSAVFYVLYVLAQGIALNQALYGVLAYLAFFNILIAVFNLVPAFPLDGGRVFRAALWQWKGDLKWATGIAANAGITFGYVLMGMGIYYMLSGGFVVGIWWILMGIFVRSAATTQLFQTRIKSALKGKRISHFMTADPISVSPDISIHDLVEDYVYRYHHKLFPVTENNQLVGSVTTAQIKNAPRQQWQNLTVRQIMVPCTDDNTVDANLDAEEMLRRVQRTKSGRLIVTDNGRLAGIVSLKDLLEVFSLQMELGGRD
jgi:Zn-dependent protease/CBS domain-containing protein